MKILFYNHTGQVSGAERVMQMILGGLDRRNYHLVVACPDQSKMFELARDTGVCTRGLQSLEARFTWRPDRLVSYLFSFARVIRKARRLVIEESPDIIHANSIRAGIVMSAATAGLPATVIWHAHDILPRHPLSSLVRLFAAVSSRNRILAVSNAVARRFRGMILQPLRNRVPITVIHNAVDRDRFRPDPRSGAEVRRELGLQPDQSVIGIVGQLTPRKGQLELIEAFAQIARESPEGVLLIAGAALFNRDDEYAKRLQQTAETLGIANQVKFLGSRSDVPGLMRAMNVLVVNSHEEPFGLTVLEGMATGVAVVASDVGGIPEMITSYQNGVLVPRCDNGALARAIRQLLKDERLRAELGRNARDTAVARFPPDRFLSEINSLYSQALIHSDRNTTHHNLNEKLAID